METTWYQKTVLLFHSIMMALVLLLWPIMIAALLTLAVGLWGWILAPVLYTIDIYKHMYHTKRGYKAPSIKYTKE